MDFFFLNVPTTNTSGLCNQLYSIAGMASYCVKNNIKYLFMNRFLKEINTENYCPISQIINIKKLNKYYKENNYNVVFFDYQTFNFTINFVKFGNDIYNVDVTDVAIEKFRKGNNFIINNYFNLLEIFGDPFEKYKSVFDLEISDNQIYFYIDLNIDDEKFYYKIEVSSEGFIKTNLNFNFNDVIFFPSLQYINESQVFFNTLKNLIQKK
jgi:hypothetical protein